MPTLIMVGLFFAVMYFLIIRPQKKRQKNHQQTSEDGGNDKEEYEALSACNTCGKEIAISSKNCPHCGASNRQSSWMVTIFVIVLVIFFIVIFNENDTKNTASQEPKPQETAYKTAQDLNYRKATLEEIPSGTLLAFTGKMSQIVGSRTAMISTDQTRFGYVGDRVYLIFENKPRIVEDDIVRIFGRYNGTETYTTVLRTEKVVPKVIVDYYKVTKPKQ